MVGDMATAMSGVMVNIGHKLGLYKAQVSYSESRSSGIAR